MLASLGSVPAFGIVVFVADKLSSSVTEMLGIALAIVSIGLFIIAGFRLNFCAAHGAESGSLQGASNVRRRIPYTRQMLSSYIERDHPDSPVWFSDKFT